MKTFLSSFISSIPPSGTSNVGISRFYGISRLNLAEDGLDVASSLMMTRLANAWSVSSPDLDSADIASSLFAASLFPYLAFLFF